VYRLRRAVNFALDPRVIADTYPWPPADHYLPARDARPPRGPSLPDRAPGPRASARARAAAAAAQCSTSATSRTAHNGRASSAETSRPSASRSSCARHRALGLARAEGADILLTRTSASHPSSSQDPVTFLQNVLGLPRSRTRLREEVTASRPYCGVAPAWFRASRFERELERIRRLGGRDREAAAGALDHEIARAAPAAVLVTENVSQSSPQGSAARRSSRSHAQAT
jgi:hypothetical protein